MEELGLKEGSAVEVRPVNAEHDEADFHRGIDAFVRTESQHRNTYKALSES
jgi:hypothetical protein